MKIILKITGNKCLDVSVNSDDTFYTLQERLQHETGIRLSLHQLGLGKGNISADQNVLQYFNDNGMLEDELDSDVPETTDKPYNENAELIPSQNVGDKSIVDQNVPQTSETTVASGTSPSYLNNAPSRADATCCSNGLQKESNANGSGLYLGSKVQSHTVSKDPTKDTDIESDKDETGSKLMNLINKVQHNALRIKQIFGCDDVRIPLAQKISSDELVSTEYESKFRSNTSITQCSASSPRISCSDDKMKSNPNMKYYTSSPNILPSYGDNVSEPYVEVKPEMDVEEISTPVHVVKDGVEKKVGEGSIDVECKQEMDSENFCVSQNAMWNNPGQLCRLCALPAKSMIYIFGEDGTQQELAPKINTWLPTRVSRKDALPKQVCSPCIEQLLICQRFSLSVMRAEYALQGLVKEDSFRMQPRSDTELETSTSRHNVEISGEAMKSLNNCCPLCCEGKMGTVDESTVTDDTESDLNSSDSDEDSVTRFTRKIGEFLDGRADFDCLSEERSDVSEFDASDDEEMIEDQQEVARSPKREEEGEAVKSEPEIHKCRICGDYLLDMEQSMLHSLQKHGNGDVNFYPCVECDKIFRTGTDLTRHYSYTHKFTTVNQITEVQYSCFTCDEKFNTHDLLLSHKCEPAGDLTCDNCGLVFDNKERLIFHCKLHQKQKPLYCEHCKEGFGDEATLFFHVKSAHEDVVVKELKQFVCEQCGRTYQNKSAYLMHLRRHRVQHSFKCDLCSKSFTDKQTLKEHFISHMDVKPFQCHICGKYLNRQSRLKKHLLSHKVQSVEPQALYCCSNCNEVLPTEQNAVEHAQNSCGPKMEEGNELYFELNSYEKVYRCEYCEQCFSSHDALNIHRNGHKTPRLFACNVCGIEFSTYARVQTHKVAHNNKKNDDESPKEDITVPKMFGCDACSKAYIHWTYLSVHRKLQHAEVKHMYKCKLCPEMFPNSWGVAYHRKTRHPEEEGGGALAKRKPFKCNLCGRRYVTELSLQNHQATQHEGENTDGTGNSYQCEECGKMFLRKMALDSHMRSHSGQKPFMCQLCSKTFVHPSGLSSHMRRHKGDKPHSCSYCGKKFLQRSDRNDHERKHTGERPFTCEICGKTFRTRAMWFEHGRIHRDERPFPCDFCGLAFRRSYALKNHRMIHTGERNFVCKFCHRSFRIKQDLQKHERSRHQNEMVPMVKEEMEVEENVDSSTKNLILA